jgi:hypothetical protein
VWRLELRRGELQRETRDGCIGDGLHDEGAEEGRRDLELVAEDLGDDQGEHQKLVIAAGSLYRCRNRGTTNRAKSRRT